MDVTPEQRQLAIDAMTQTLVESGMDDERATEFATEVVDEAVKRGVS